MKTFNRNRLIIVVLFFLFTTAFAEQNPIKKYRPFSAPNGRSMVGRIIKYNKTKQKILFEMENKKKRWVSPSIFCKKDQIYIQKWIEAEQFLSKESIKIFVKEIRVRKVTHKTVTRETDFAINQIEIPVVYELKIQNSLKVPIHNIIIEYNWFVEKKIYNKEHPYQICIKGRIVVDEPFFNQTITYKTSQIVLSIFIKRQLYSVAKIKRMTSKQRIKMYTTLIKQRTSGIWFKIYGPTLDNVPLVKNISIPPDLIKTHTWVPVGKPSPFDAVLITKYSQINEPPAVLAFNEFGAKGLIADSTQRKEIIKNMIHSYIPINDRQLTGFFSNWIASLLDKEGNFQEALVWYKKSFNFGNTKSGKLLVEHYAFSCPEVYDGKKAVKFALILINNLSDYELLAAAYARNNQFIKAIAFQNKAITLYNKKTNYKKKSIRMEKRLERYKKQKPLTVKYVESEPH